MQAPDAALLLRAGVARLQSRPRRGSQLVAWLQALVAAHTAFFIAAPGEHALLDEWQSLWLLCTRPK